MRGTKVWRAGAWRLVVYGGRDPVTGKKRWVNRTVKVPKTRAGERKADTELAKLVAEVEAGRALPSTGATTDQVLEAWIRAMAPGWSPAAEHQTRQRAANHIAPHLGSKVAGKLRPIDVTEWYATLRRKGLAESTVRRLHDILHSALAWAVRMEIGVTRNVTDRVERPVKGRTVKNPPEPAVVMRLMNAAVSEPELVLFVRLAALNGPRRGQLVALRWLDVDLDAGLVRWVRARVEVPGRSTVEKGTKTDAQWPSSLDPVTVELLRAHRLRCAERALAVGVALADEAFVFSRDPAGRMPWHPSGASQRFARLRRKAKVDGVKLKDLRDYMATEMLGEGVDPKVMAERGGWSDPSTPLAIYSAFRPARDKAAAEQLAHTLDESG